MTNVVTIVVMKMVTNVVTNVVISVNRVDDDRLCNYGRVCRVLGITCRRDLTPCDLI